MAIPAIAPAAGQCMLLTSRFERLVTGQGAEDGREVTLEGVPVPAFPLPSEIALELPCPLGRIGGYSAMSLWSSCSNTSSIDPAVSSSPRRAASIASIDRSL